MVTVNNQPGINLPHGTTNVSPVLIYAGCKAGGSTTACNGAFSVNGTNVGSAVFSVTPSSIRLVSDKVSTGFNVTPTNDASGNLVKVVIDGPDRK